MCLKVNLHVIIEEKIVNDYILNSETMKFHKQSEIEGLMKYKDTVYGLKIICTC